MSKMTEKTIRKRLEEALLQQGEMEYDLYEFELEELLEELKTSMVEDGDHYIYAITVHTGDVAMVLIERTGELYINEPARERLKELWLENYEHNIKQLIPSLAKQLNEDAIPISGVKVVDTS